MNTKEAVAERIIQICKERNMAINALANISGVSPSTIHSMLKRKARTRASFRSRSFATDGRSAFASFLIHRSSTTWSRRYSK